MKQGLSLRVSQHLALTPQLQQSIRLLQLSTLELSQEVEQMLDENPFLEVTIEEASREDFGLAQSDERVRDEDREAEAISAPGTEYTYESPAESSSSEAESPLTGTEDSHDWEGDGTHDIAADDGEWGGDAQPRKNN